MTQAAATQSQLANARSQGYAAGMKGRESSSNPYLNNPNEPAGCDAHWMEGYDAAQERIRAEEDAARAATCQDHPELVYDEDEDD